MDQQETFAWGLDVPNVSCHYKLRMCQMSCQYEMRMPKRRCLDQLYNTFSFVGHLSWVNQSCYFPKSPSIQLTPKTCQISLVAASVSKEFHLSMSETNMKRIVMKLEISFLQSLSKKHPRWRCMMLHFSCHCSNCDFLSASMHPQLHSLSYWKVGWVFWSLSQPWKSRALQSSPSAQWLHVHQWFPVKSPWNLHFDESTSIFCWYCSTLRFQALRSSHVNLHKEDSATPVNSGAALVRPPWTHGKNR